MLTTTEQEEIMKRAKALCRVAVRRYAHDEKAQRLGDVMWPVSRVKSVENELRDYLKGVGSARS